jgi:heat-inducible transcriptional repressor
VLTARRAAILRYVVDEYVNSGQPVASRTVAQKYRLPISPATIRNEMMRLEEEGYLHQPHTSAGRVPSDKGYRYYVEWLMREETPPEAVRQRIREEMWQAARRLEEWARVAAAALAAYVHGMALVTMPHGPPARLRWLEVVKLHDPLVLVVVVLYQARVREKVLPLGEVGQEDLSDAAHRLSYRFAGMAAHQLRRVIPYLSAQEREIMNAAASLLEEEDAAAHRPAALEGIKELLGYPEFADRRQVLAILDYLEGEGISRLLPYPLPPQGGVRVVIGSEHPEEPLRHLSMVVASYPAPGGGQGGVAVVGPTRFRYGRAVGMVRYLASLMEQITQAWWGG